MEEKTLKLTYPLGTHSPTINDIENVIHENLKDFHVLLWRFIDENDARTTLLEDSVQVEHVTLPANSDEGSFDLQFESEFYAGCKDMNSTDEHETTEEFFIENGQLIIDMLLPPKWGASDVY